MSIATLAIKDLRLIARDYRAAVVLLGMPVLFILVLGIILDDRLRVSVVVEDVGPTAGDGPPAIGGNPPPATWTDVVLRDLEQTAGIRVERIKNRATAEELVNRGDRAAVLVFGPEFSARVGRCSFLDDRFLKKPGLNPFFRDGIDLRLLAMDVLRDPAQDGVAAVTEQVAQVTLLRVVMPWMIGRAFEEVGRRLPIAVPLLKELFAKYDLTAKNWASLTRSKAAPTREAKSQVDQTSGSLLHRGTVRYQTLVPAFTVTFAFFLVLSAGWLFVAERRQGTLIRLRAAPLSRWQILAGKLLPCLAVSLAQGTLLLLAGKVAFGMALGPKPWLLVPVVASTAVAATGLALLVAAVARTESQVAVYGTLLVLVLAGLSGGVLPRGLMSESMRPLTKITPHAWALEAYNQLLLHDQPNVAVVAGACGMLLLFGTAFLALGWWRLRLE